jgi:hypothetical protein
VVLPAALSPAIASSTGRPHVENPDELPARAPLIISGS